MILNNIVTEKIPKLFWQYIIPSTEKRASQWKRRFNQQILYKVAKIYYSTIRYMDSLTSSNVFNDLLSRIKVVALSRSDPMPSLDLYITLLRKESPILA